MKNFARVLVVDDDAAEIRLTLAALEKAGIQENIQVLADGNETLDYLYRRGSFADVMPMQPALILLDLKMSPMDGFRVLETVKNDPAIKNIPLVVLTTSSRALDLEQAYALGASGYVVKPMEFDDYLAALEAIVRFWLLINEAPTGCAGWKEYVEKQE
jgi:CheY-like chemotaxis protein